MALVRSCRPREQPERLGRVSRAGAALSCRSVFSGEPTFLAWCFLFVVCACWILFAEEPYPEEEGGNSCNSSRRWNKDANNCDLSLGVLLKTYCFLCRNCLHLQSCSPEYQSSFERERAHIRLAGSLWQRLRLHSPTVSSFERDNWQLKATRSAIIMIKIMTRQTRHAALCRHNNWLSFSCCILHGRVRVHSAQYSLCALSLFAQF